MNSRVTTLLLTAALSLPVAAEHEHGATGPARDPKSAWEKSLARTPLAVTAAFDARGRLWRVQVKDGQVQVSHSADRGRTYSPPVSVNREPERVAAEGENRPKLAFGRDGEVYVSWTQSLEQPYSGHVRFSRSLDDGKTFGAPITVNDDTETISHRFDSLLVDGRGRVWLTWLDKRDQSAAKRRGESYTGAALYYAVSADRGASFTANRKLADHSCECCRIALALDTDDTPVALWRHVFGKNTRDHALQRLDGRSPLVRASFDDWAVDACPHHGPALAIAADGKYHLAWFSGAPQNAGLYYAYSKDRGRTFSAALRFGNPEAQPGHPQVLSVGNTLYLAWKEFDGRASVVRAMTSHDAGRHWSASRTLATTTSASDHPLLISDDRVAYLSWNTLDEGHRVIAILADRDRP